MGYHRAGFDVVGVDINLQPHYPFPYCHMDALAALALLLGGHRIWDTNDNWWSLSLFDAFHASPPCQFGSTMTKGRWKDRKHPNLIPDTRHLLDKTGKPYVIENVEGSREHLITPVKLCGTMLGLGTSEGNQLRRHRYFECKGFWLLVPPCNHNKASSIGVYGGGQHPQRRKPLTIGVWGHAGGTSKRDGLVQFGTDARREAMGIEWMNGSELSEAIPPAYTEFIGKHLIGAIKEVK